MRRHFGCTTLALALAVTISTTSRSQAAPWTLLVSSIQSNEVLEYDATTGAFLGAFVTADSGGLRNPFGLAIGPDGNLYVASLGGGEVLRYDGETGAFLDAFVPNSSGLRIPYNVLFGPGDDLFVTSSTATPGDVAVYDYPTGAFQTVINDASLVGATGAVIGPDGNLYVSSFQTDSIFVFDPLTGTLLNSFTDPLLLGPNGLVFGKDGYLYVATKGNDSVVRIASDGTSAAIFATGGGLDDPIGLAFGPDGNLYVAAELSNAVLKYNGTTGAFVSVFVTAGSGGLNGASYLLFVPEPGSFALVGFGLTALAGYAVLRRRKRA